MQIAKGAEAELTREDGIVVKERIKKGYRLKEIDDKLRKRRTALEARLLAEARRAGVNTPAVLEENDTTLRMEFIDGDKVRDILNKDNYAAVCGEIGRSIALLHSYDIIHGDLTTSNMIIKQEGSLSKEKGHALSLFLIDFGLGFVSKREEDKAVDLYVLHEALESTHFDILEEAWAVIIEAYKKHYEGSEKVIKALWNVEKRGRYKTRDRTGPASDK